MSQERKPDILLFVLDTLRADRLSSYGYPRDTSPHMDECAEDGVLFEWAISPAQWTIPSHASLFTGEYPTTHRTTQIYDKHSEETPTLAELLNRAGYRTVGFCNNPLLGVVENDLDRGFEEFYNYGGALPTRPEIVDSGLPSIGQFARWLTKTTRRLTSPIQDAFARSNLLLRIALHPRIVPIWRRYANFKGNTVQSLRDLNSYLRARERKGAERPLFAFINVMETHLPYAPRPRFIRKFAPSYWQDREARSFMERYNHEHYRWMVPLREPLTELQDRTINDLYAAEVAYLDHLLRRIFEYLETPSVRENTMLILTSDHGEGLNNHDFVGHSLVAYDDLIRVPLILRYPRLYPAGKRVTRPISARRIFHSVLEAAGVDTVSEDKETADRAPIDVKGLSLRRALEETDSEGGIAFTEAYVPDTLIALMEAQDPEAIETYRCRQMRRAVYRSDYKLITVGDRPDELFDLSRDPGELVNLISEKPNLAAELESILEDFVRDAEARTPDNWRENRVRLEEDRELTERLKGLGYLS